VRFYKSGSSWVFLLHIYHDYKNTGSGTWLLRDRRPTTTTQHMDEEKGREVRSNFRISAASEPEPTAIHTPANPPGVRRRQGRRRRRPPGIRVLQDRNTYDTRACTRAQDPAPYFRSIPETDAAPRSPTLSRLCSDREKPPPGHAHCRRPPSSHQTRWTRATTSAPEHARTNERSRGRAQPA
jgi:hypothetical protein